MKCSIDDSTGFVLRELRKVCNPGVAIDGFAAMSGTLQDRAVALISGSESLQCV
jgi:hypothetical protein